MGSDLGEAAKGRLRKDLHEDSSVLPNLVINQKDHKLPDPVSGPLKTRPVCRLLAPTTKDLVICEPTKEALGTEDILSKVEALNA